MKKQITLFFLSIALLTVFVSCGGGDSKEDLYIPIKSVRATTSALLSKRTDWEFYVNRNVYKATITGRTIHAQPKSDEGITYFIIYGNEENSASQTRTVLMTLASPKYHLKKDIGSKMKMENELTHTELLDQSTIDKMLTVDAFSIFHKTSITSHIDNVKLEHNHSLIDYTFEGLPDGAETKLLASSAEMRPFVSGGLYQAILVYPHLASVQVKVEGEVHTVSLDTYIKKLPAGQRSVKDMHYSFVVKYDAEETDTNKMLTIEDMTSQKWSKEELDAEKLIMFDE